MLLYSTDEDINLIRRSLKQAMPKDVSSWLDFHKQCSGILETDLTLLFVQKFADSPAFNPLYLRSGFHYNSTETTAVAQYERVYVDYEHGAGGNRNSVYMLIGDALTITDLQTVDFSDDTVWLEINNQMRLAASYLTIALIYEYLSTDRAEEDGFYRQHKIYMDKYKEELQKQHDIGFSYDWDASGDVDSSDTQPESLELETTVIW